MGWPRPNDAGAKMNRTIWKYAIKLGAFELNIPRSGQVLCVQDQFIANEPQMTPSTRLYRRHLMRLRP